MPNYHLHLHNTHVDAIDEEGHDLPDLEAARAKAFAGVRGFLGNEALSGKLDFRGQIDIADESGRVLEVIRFREAFMIIGL